MKRIICVVLSFFALALAPAFAQEPNKASAEITNPTPHFHGGDEVNFKMKLNEPLPKGARIDVRFSPTSVGQQFPASCEEPTDADRKEQLCKLKLSDNARGGEWRIYVVYFFLPGVSWTNSTIAADLKFIVDGPDGPLPSSATATFVKK
jgi:hypothetical protein